MPGWRRALLRARFGMLNVYPPYVGAGIRLLHVSSDLLTFDVAMRMHLWNRNYVGTHFGGSLYSMCDPFFMLILFEQLGREHVVWDKAASIRFRRPGRGTVTAHFHIPASEIEDIRQRAAVEPKVEPTFHTCVVDARGQVVAEVEKLCYVRRKGARG
ncbi:MAG: DUF4442 domain-containing protein [Acidobacteriota bacterium]